MSIQKGEIVTMLLLILAISGLCLHKNNFLLHCAQRNYLNLFFVLLSSWTRNNSTQTYCSPFPQTLSTLPNSKTRNPIGLSLPTVFSAMTTLFTFLTQMTSDFVSSNTSMT